MNRSSEVRGEMTTRAFGALVERLVTTHRTFAPQLRDGAIVFEELADPADLPLGVTLEQGPGHCRVRPLPEGDRRRFAWAVGPTSPKSVLHPPARPLFEAVVDDDGVFTTALPPTDDRPVALLGVRPCDVAGMEVLRHVLGDAAAGADAFVVAVNCTEPGGTCFCHSMGTGPSLPEAATAAVDLELWERDGADGDPRYLVAHTSARGRALLEDLELGDAPPDAATWARAAHERAVEAMGRVLQTEGLAVRLLATVESAAYDEVASRCLSCGNCTMVCPTCFCSSVHDVADLSDGRVRRDQRWDTCFSLDHSFVHGGSVRATTADRYRQWLTHKLSTWWAQFGESGCVGCGRCISWCPVGIDLVQEANRLAEEAGDRMAADGSPATAVFLRTRVGAS